jgi:hypothetical protein
MLRSTQVCVSGAQKVHLSKEKVFRSVSNKVPICLRTQEGDDTPWSDDLTSQRRLPVAVGIPVIPTPPARSPNAVGSKQ